MTISEQLRETIADSGLTLYRIAKDSGVSFSIVHRFASGERAVKLSTADQLAEYFGMRLTKTMPRTPQTKINTELNYVCRTFFSRWDRKGEWQFQQVKDFSGGKVDAIGACDVANKVIQVVSRAGMWGLRGQAYKLLLQSTLIHEIAHAITWRAGKHGKHWQKRVLQAAQHAESLGQVKLASRLRDMVSAVTPPKSEPTSNG